MNKLFLKILFSCIIGCSMMNSMAMDNATASEKESAETANRTIPLQETQRAQEELKKRKEEALSLQKKFVEALGSIHLIWRNQDNFSYTGDGLCTVCFTRETEAETYFDNSAEAISEIYQILPSGRVRLDITKLENIFKIRLQELIRNEMQNTHIILDYADFSAQEEQGNEPRIDESVKILLDALKKIGSEAHSLKKKLLHETNAYKHIIDGTKIIIGTELDKALEKIGFHPSLRKHLVPEITVSSTAQAQDKQPVKTIPTIRAPFNWKSYALTATIASAATLGIACAVLKASGYKLIK